MAVFATITKNWFLIGIFIVIICAYVAPSIGRKGGFIKPEITIKYFAVGLIFLNSGLSLKTEELKNALMQIRLHTFIQTFTLIFIPIVMQFVISLMRMFTPLSTHLINGFVVVSCMPPPVSSAVILTKTVGGNEAAAIFNSAFGSFLGIIVTPMLLLMTLGLSGAVPFSKIFIQLFFTVVVPILIGQLLRIRIKSWMERTQPPFGPIASFTLLMIIYSAFCDTFSNNDVNIAKSDLFTVLFFVILLQVVFLTIVFKITPMLNFLRGDTVCAMYCATHKSLTLGIPMLKIIYSGDPMLSFITIPLLMYHPCQIVLGGLLAPKLKVWLQRPSRLDI